MSELKVEKWYVEKWIKKAKLLKHKALHMKIRRWRWRSWYCIEALSSNNELIYRDYLDKDDLEMLLRALNIVYNTCEMEERNKNWFIECENEDF